MDNYIEEIKKLKEERNAVILAHYYVDEEVQKIADYVGDSYFLAKKAVETDADVICFAGVLFMGESAKILNPEKTVIMPDITADCPMAHMVTKEAIEKVRGEYDDLAVICYINSTAEIKSYSDVCVTSSNAERIVKKLPQKNIFFIPDENLGRYIAKQIPDKNFIFNDGYCPVHKKLTREAVLQAKEKYHDAKVLTHPECTMEVLEVSDFIGSTSEIIEFASKSEEKEFIIATETGVFYELMKAGSGKKFYPVQSEQCCADMKKVSMENTRDCLKSLTNQVELDEQLRLKAKKALDEMLRLAK